MVPAAAIVEAARAMIGTPFHHQGRAPGIGLDCAGLVVCSYRAAGLPIIDRIDYSELPRPAEMEYQIRRNSVQIDPDSLAAGDVLWLRFGEPQHLAIYTGAGTIVHALSTRGMVCEHGFRAPWTRRLVSAWRHAEVAQ